jgi:hypothetical protein
VELYELGMFLPAKLMKQLEGPRLRASAKCANGRKR